MGDLKRWQKLALWAADNFPKNKLSQDLAYKIISDPQVGYQAGATTKDVARNVFSSKPKEEDTNKYMFVYGADTRRPETTIGQAYNWSEDIKENGYENVKTYSGVLNPHNEYLVDSRNKGLVEEFAKVSYSPVSNINNEYIDWNTYRLKQGTPYFDDVHGYRPTFHFNNGKPVISSSDLYDFGKNYIGDFTDLYVERSGNEKDPAFTMELQRRALNSVGQPYLLVQKNIPIRFVDNPQGNEIWRTNNFNKELRLDEMSDREVSNILHTGYIEPAVITAYKKGGRIHIKKKNRGSFTRWCKGKVTEECIRRGKNSSNPAIRKKATFAANARRWKHENGGILKAQEGTGNLLTPHPLSPVGIALNQAKAMAKGKTHLPSGVKEVVGPDGKKVTIRTEQPLVPLEQSIAEWLPGTGDVAEVGYIANDVKNGNLGSATLGAGLLLLPGNAGKLLKTNVGKKVSNFLDKDLFNYDELWAKVKHPTWQKYYHGSPKEFDIKNFHKGTIADSGLHMSDRKEVAEYFAESGPYNPDKSTVYEFYAPKPTLEFMDLHRNGINMLSGNTQRIAGNHLGKGTFDGTPHGQLEYRALRESGGEDVIDFLPTYTNDRFGNTIEPYQLKRDVTIPIEKYHWPDRPKHVDDRLKEMRKQYDTAIENSDYDTVELLNSEVSDIMAENGIPVVKYANNNAFEGGGMSYMLFDRSKLHLINPEHQFKMKHALTGLGTGLGVGYGVSQLKDE